MEKLKPKEPSKKISATDKMNAEYTVSNAFKYGDKFTKLSMFILGAGNLAHKEYTKGILFLLTEISFLIYLITTGFNSIFMLGSLGEKETGEVFNESKQIYEYVIGDNSMLILLYGVATFFIIAGFVIIWRAGVKSAYKVQVKSMRNQHIPTFKEEMLTYLDGNLHKTLLFLPSMGIILFTIIPVVFMMTMAFTNYDRDHQPPGNLFHWIGLTNFKQLLDFSGELGRTFWHVLGWTVVWAIFATFLNYFFAMIIALVINRKGTKFKSFWRCNLYVKKKSYF